MHDELCAPGCRQVSSAFKIEVRPTYSNLCTARPLECLCICRTDKQVCLSFTSTVHVRTLAHVSPADNSY